MKLNFHELKAHGIVCREELCMLFVVVNESSKREYRSLVKKGPVSNIRPPPIIASIFRKGLKFTPKSAHPIDLKFLNAIWGKVSL